MEEDPVWVSGIGGADFLASFFFFFQGYSICGCSHRWEKKEWPCPITWPFKMQFKSLDVVPLAKEMQTGKSSSAGSCSWCLPGGIIRICRKNCSMLTGMHLQQLTHFWCQGRSLTGSQVWCCCEGFPNYDMQQRWQWMKQEWAALLLLFLLCCQCHKQRGLQHLLAQTEGKSTFYKCFMPDSELRVLHPLALTVVCISSMSPSLSGICHYIPDTDRPCSSAIELCCLNMTPCQYIWLILSHSRFLSMGGLVPDFCVRAACIVRYTTVAF